jgi:hypothetical protein
MPDPLPKRLPLRIAATLALLVGVGVLLTGKDAGQRFGATTPAPAPTPAASERVVFVMIDSLDVHDATDPTVMPFLARDLPGRGVSGPMQACGLMATLACLRTMMEGRDSPLVAGFANFATRHEDVAAEAWPGWLARAGARVSVIGDHTLPALYGSAFASADTYEARGLPFASRDEHAYAEARRWLDRPRSERLDVLILHLTWGDKLAHHVGFAEPEHKAAFRSNDAFLAELAGRLGAEDTLIVAGDHGHQLTAGGHTRSTMFFAAGPRFSPGARAAIGQASLLYFLNALALVPLPATYEGALHPQALRLDPASLEAWRKAQAAAWGTGASEAEIGAWVTTRGQGLARARGLMALVVAPLLLAGLWLLGFLRRPRHVAVAVGLLAASVAAGASFEDVRGHLHYNDHVATGAIFVLYYGVYIGGGGWLLARLLDLPGTRTGRLGAGFVLAAALLSFVSAYHYGSFRAVPTVLAASLLAVFVVRRELPGRQRLYGAGAALFVALGTIVGCTDFIRVTPLGDAYGALPLPSRLATEALVAVLLMVPTSSAGAASTQAPRRLGLHAATGVLLLGAGHALAATPTLLARPALVWGLAALVALYALATRLRGLPFAVLALEAGCFQLGAPGTLSLLALALAAAWLDRALPGDEPALRLAVGAVLPVALFGMMLTSLGFAGIDFAFAFPLVWETVAELPWALQIALLAGLKYLLPQLLLPAPATPGARLVAAKALLAAAFLAGTRIDVGRHYMDLALEEVSLLVLVLVFPILRAAGAWLLGRLAAQAPTTIRNRTVPVPMP